MKAFFKPKPPGPQKGNGTSSPKPLPPRKVTKKQVIVVAGVGVVLIPLLIMLMPSSEKPQPVAQEKNTVSVAHNQPETDLPDPVREAMAEEEIPSNRVAVAAPKDAGWVLRLPALRSAQSILTQKPIQQLLNESRFPFSKAALNSAFYVSKFDPTRALENLGGVFDGPITTVGMRRMNRWQGYAYARVRKSAWDLWRSKMLQDPSNGWSEAGDQMLVRPLNLSFAMGEISDPLLVYSNGSVVCIAVGEQAMDEFISIWKNPSSALQVRKAEIGPRTIQCYASAEAIGSAKGILFNAFMPAMVQRHPALRDPAHASPQVNIEGSITFDSTETVFDLDFVAVAPAPQGALALQNAEILKIPGSIPADAINFFRIEANLGEVMMDIAAKNREDRSFADRAYTRFYTSREYFPMEKLPELMGTNAYRFQIPGRQSGQKLATVWVWEAEDGPAMADSLGAVLMAESSGSINITVKRQGQLSLFEIPLEGETWYMVGVDKRVFFTNEVAALMARSHVDRLVDSMQIPEQLLQDKAMIFYRNQNRLPKVLNKRPIDLSSFPSIWWYIARVYPYQIGMISETEDGAYRAQSWMRF